MEKRYIAFISYRHRTLDAAVATALHRLIERYKVPGPFRKNGKRQLGLAFRDKEELTLGSSLDEKIQHALDLSDHLIVVCTPETPESYWCCQEIDYFLSCHNREKVLLILADGTPDTSIPPQLLHIYDKDGTTILQHVEPLCADLTSHSKNTLVKILTARIRLGDEFLRLAAAILGCSYDDLKQRKRRRNRRILLAASATALAIIGALTMQNLTIRQQNREISEQKVQIEQQLQKTLLNESEALALISSQQLEEGNRRSALTAAVQALPYGENQRPYSAKAEYALSKSLYAYLEDSTQFDTLAEQETDIIALDVSANGKHAVTLDTDGCVRCFDMDTQTKQWSCNLRSWNMDPVAASAYVNSIHILDSQQAVLCVDQWAVTLLSLKDGSILRKQEQIGAYYGDIAVPSPDGNWLSVLANNSLYLYNTQNDQIRSCSFSPTSGDERPDYVPLDCCFSLDGTTFAALFSQRTEQTGDSASVIVFWDLRTLEAYWVSYPVSGTDACITALEDDRFLVSYSTETQYHLLCLTLEGITVYEQTLDIALPTSAYRSFHPADTHLGLNSGRIAAICASSDVVCWVYDNAILAVNADDGSLLQMIPLNTRCLWGSLSDDSRLYYILADGTVHSCTLGDAADEILMDCGFPLAIGWGETAGMPCYVVVPENNPSRCLRLIYNHSEWGQRLDTTNFPGEKRVYRDPSGSQILICAAESIDSLHSTRTGVLYDTQTLMQTRLIPMDYNSFSSFSSQGTQLFLSSSILDVHTGQTREMEYGSPGIDYVSIRKPVPLSDQREGTPLLTAGLCGDTLIWWLDGGSPRQTVCPCPDMTMLFPDPYWDVIDVGQNGLIAMQYSDSPDAAFSYIPCPTTTFAIFDTETEAWTLLDNPSENPTMPARICVGIRDKRMAFLDEHGILRLYDLPTDSLVLEADIQITAAAVDQMNFIRNDQILLITQINGSVTAVDIATGETAASWQIQNYDRNYELLICEDASRLYLCETGGNISGMCIDLDSWIVIADIPGLACWLPATGEIVRINPENGTVSVGAMYSLNELIELAQMQNGSGSNFNLEK